MSGTASITKTLLLFSFLFCSINSFSQDAIHKVNLDSIQSKILEVGITEIKYKRADNIDGPVFVIPKSEVAWIRYENGTTDSFPPAKTAEPAAVTGNAASSTTAHRTEPAPVPELSAEQLVMKGQKDATRHYDGYKGAGTGTLAASLVSPVLGLIPAIACASTKPKTSNLNYPDPALINNYSYNSGYTKRAKQIKQGRVWTNWGIGLGVNFILALALIK